MGLFSSKLAGMKQAWADSSTVYDSTFGGIKIDAGQYLARLQSAKITESKSSGKLMIRREHVILEGQFKGMIVYDNLNLETPMGMSFVRRWIEQMGYDQPDVDKPEEIEDIVAAISQEAPTVKVAVKHSGDFVNVSIIELITTDSAAGESGQAQAKAEASSSAKKEKVAPWDEKNPLKENLFAFCKGQDISTQSDDTIEVLKERIREYTYPKEQMTDEEQKLFAEAGLEDTYEKKPESKPEQKKKPVAKKKK